VVAKNQIRSRCGCIAHLAVYFTRCKIPRHVFVTGEASISGEWELNTLASDSANDQSLD
jgi:hypothetical protein